MCLCLCVYVCARVFSRMYPPFSPTWVASPFGIASISSTRQHASRTASYQSNTYGSPKRIFSRTDPEIAYILREHYIVRDESKNYDDVWGSFYLSEARPPDRQILRLSWCHCPNSSVVGQIRKFDVGPQSSIEEAHFFQNQLDQQHLLIFFYH